MSRHGSPAGFFAESLFGGCVLSPADVLFASGSFSDVRRPDYEPANRLLIDPVLQFQPWLEFNRTMLRSGRLPLWNPMAGCGAPHLANGQSAVFDPFNLIAYLGELPGAIAWMSQWGPTPEGSAFAVQSPEGKCTVQLSYVSKRDGTAPGGGKLWKGAVTSAEITVEVPKAGSQPNGGRPRTGIAVPY